MAYRKVISILILCLLPCAVWAGTEVLNPDGNVLAEWTAWNCSGGSEYSCMSDNDDGTGISIYDDASNGYRELFTFSNPSTTDSTIDSVVFSVIDSGAGGSGTYAIFDSLVGGHVDSSSALTFGVTYTTKTFATTTQPGSGTPWSWTALNDLIAGVIATGIGNKKTAETVEMWATVYFHAEGAGGAYQGQIISIGGD